MRRRRFERGFLALALLLLALGCAPAETGLDEGTPDTDGADGAEVAERDALAPKTSADDAVTRQLHTATIVTADLEGTLSFYRDAMGLSVAGPLEESEETKSTQAQLWGMGDEDFETYLLHRDGAPGTAQIRLLVVSGEAGAIHTSASPLEPGPFSLGFPTEDAESWDREIREAGFDSLNVIEKYQVPRTDGTTYGIHETIFNAPDFVHAVIISRRDGMAQLGPVDPATGRGGPVYSAMIVEDSEAFVEGFLVGVLGFELRSDREWTSAGTEGALNVPDGTRFRFAITYAHGASYGHQLILEFRDGRALDVPPNPPRPPHRGLGSWTFPVRSMEEIQERVNSAGAPVVHGPVELESTELGRHRAMTVLAPNGFLIELVELEGG